MKKINKNKIENKILENTLFGANEFAYTLTFNLFDPRIYYIGEINKEGKINYNYIEKDNLRNIITRDRNRYSCNYNTCSRDSNYKHCDVYFHKHESEDGKEIISFTTNFTHTNCPDKSTRITKILSNTCEYITDTLDLYINILFLNGGISFPIIRIKNTTWKDEEVLDLINDSYLFNSYGLPVTIKTEVTNISVQSDLKVDRYNDRIDQLLDLYKFEEEDVLYSDTGEVLNYYNKSSRIGFRREYREDGWKDIVTAFDNVINTTEYKKTVTPKYAEYSITYDNGVQDIVRIYNDDKNTKFINSDNKKDTTEIDKIYTVDDDICVDSVYDNVMVSKRYNNSSYILNSLRIVYRYIVCGEVKYVDLLNWRQVQKGSNEYIIDFADVSGIKYSMAEKENIIMYREGDMEALVNNNKVMYIKSHIYNNDDQLYIRDMFGIPSLVSENYEGYCEIYKDFMNNFNKPTLP